ncbi:hypothetical protein BJV78DRAFT_1272479 [Lactifluus subvellereus]|nr:hypothetical protein BJV78DRAFT_1272479 [Lactifluus subvellereus]
MTMTRILTISLLFASACATVLSTELSGFVQWNEHCADGLQLGHAKVVLDNSIASGSITRDGGFLIPDVAAGTYILSVVSRDHVFDKLRVDVPPEPKSPPEVHAYTIGTPLNPLSPDYFVPHQSFNVLQMFQNPMMLIMVFGGLMMLAMPYIMKNVDPEVLRDAQQSQARINALRNSDLSLTPVPGNDDKRSAVTTATPSQGGSSNNAMKHRGKKRRT